MIRCIDWTRQPASTGWVLKTEVKNVLKNWENAALEKLKETKADHVVYAYKKYINDGNVETFELNLMMTPLNNEQFYNRTASLGSNYLVYALHKGTNC